MMSEDDYKIEIIYTATGTTERPGGQYAGMPPTEVRVTHIPTGLMAQCGEHRSRHRNKMIAMAMIEYGLVEIGSG